MNDTALVETRRFLCPHCGKMYPFLQQMVGRKMRCKGCQQPFLVDDQGDAQILDADQDRRMKTGIFPALPEAEGDSAKSSHAAGAGSTDVVIEAAPPAQQKPQIFCPSCHTAYPYVIKMRGLKLRCRNCKNAFMVGDGGQAAKVDAKEDALTKTAAWKISDNGEDAAPSSPGSEPSAPSEPSAALERNDRAPASTPANHVTCPSCGKQAPLTSAMKGRVVTCGGCRKAYAVDAQGQAEPISSGSRSPRQASGLHAAPPAPARSSSKVILAMPDAAPVAKVRSNTSHGLKAQAKADTGKRQRQVADAQAQAVPQETKTPTPKPSAQPAVAKQVVAAAPLAAPAPVPRRSGAALPWTLCLVVLGGALWWQFDGQARMFPPPPPPEPVIVVKQLPPPPPPPPAWKTWQDNWISAADHRDLLWPTSSVPETFVLGEVSLRSEASYQAGPAFSAAFAWRQLSGRDLWVPAQQLSQAQEILAAWLEAHRKAETSAPEETATTGPEVQAAVTETTQETPAAAATAEAAPQSVQEPTPHSAEPTSTTATTTDTATASGEVSGATATDVGVAASPEGANNASDLASVDLAGALAQAEIPVRDGAEHLAALRELAGDATLAELLLQLSAQALPAPEAISVVRLAQADGTLVRLIEVRGEGWPSGLRLMP